MHACNLEVVIHAQTNDIAHDCCQEPKLYETAFRKIKETKRLGALRLALKFSLPTLAGSALVVTRAGQQVGLQFWLFGHIGHHWAKKRAAPT